MMARFASWCAAAVVVAAALAAPSIELRAQAAQRTFAKPEEAAR